MTRNKVVLIWLDAFSDRYLQQELCPFLSEISYTRLFAKISPIFAYWGIRNCFDTGVSINTHQTWNDHIFCKSPTRDGIRSSIFRSSVSLIDKISPSDEVNKILRYLMFKLNKKEYGTPHLIPADLLDFFPITDSIHQQESMYDLFEKNGIRHVWIEPKLSLTEQVTLGGIPNLLKSHDVVFAKLNSLDRLGHKYGPTSRAVRRRARYLDELIAKLARELDGRAILLVMSEHGMVPVLKTYDLVSHLRREGFEFGSQYIGFFGATYASFWFTQESCREKVKADMQTLRIGRFLTLDDKVNLGIDNIGEDYGEEIFAIKETSVFFPEFYHVRIPPKGMHGYAFNEYDKPVFFLISGEHSMGLKDKNIRFIDIMPTILRLLDLPIPSNVEGISLV